MYLLFCGNVVDVQVFSVPIISCHHGGGTMILNIELNIFKYTINSYI